jgi:hypothetical protein
VFRTALIIAAVAAVIGGVGYWMFAPGSSSALDRTALTEVTDPGAVQKMVQVSNPTVAISENYVGEKIRLIGATVKNTSDKPLRLIEVKMRFIGFDGQAVQEGVHSAYEAKQRLLDPGMDARFEIAFDNLPRTWNYRPPEMQVVKVGY